MKIRIGVGAAGASATPGALAELVAGSTSWGSTRCGCRRC